MPPFDDNPHRRFNPLTGTWTLVAVGRTKRPWSGKLDPAPVEARPVYEVGYEMLAEGRRAIPPEDASPRLQELSPVHYLRTEK